MTRRVIWSALTCLCALSVTIACSSSPSTFSVGRALVDDTAYTCPTGSNNAPYQLHVSIDAHNPTSSAVTIQSVTASMKLEAVKGGWLEKVGDTYNAGSATFTPAGVAAGATTTIKVTISSACTSGKTATAAPSYGEYRVTLHLTASSGSYATTTANRHRLTAS
ncbi:MAG: hypothetical protein ACREOM_11430 [Candidatus Dormibacteraceae bacterium]